MQFFSVPLLPVRRYKHRFIMGIFSKLFLVVATTALVPNVSAHMRMRRFMNEMEQPMGIIEQEHRGLDSDTGVGVDECANATDKLFEDNPDVATADDKVFDEITALEEELCGEGWSDTMTECIVDEGSVKSVPELEAACGNTGDGKMFSLDTKVRCDATNATSNVKLEFVKEYLNSPECSPCSNAALTEDNDAYGDFEATFVQGELTLAGYKDVSCTHSGAVRGPKETSSAAVPTGAISMVSVGSLLVSFVALLI